MSIEERIRSLFSLRGPRISVSPKNFQELCDAGHTPDEDGRIHLATAIGCFAVHSNKHAEDNHMLIWFCDGIAWNCPFALWEPDSVKEAMP